MMKKNVMQPAVLFSLVWFLVILLHFIFRFTILFDLYALHFTTFMVFFIGTLLFSASSLLVTLRNQQRGVSGAWKMEENSFQDGISLKLRYILLGITIIGFPFYIQAAYRVFIASNIEDFFVGLRTELSYGNEDIGPVKYLVSFSFVVYAINLYVYLKEKSKINKILFIVSLLFTVAYAVFMTGRTFLFMILVIYFGMNYLQNNRFSLKKNTWLIGLFLTVFLLIGVVLGKGGNKDVSIQENLNSSSENIAIYMVSSLNGIDWELTHQPTINYTGANNFRFFIKIGNQFNLLTNIKVSELLQEFIFIPYPTNVYTFYSPYIKDFGKLYAWIMISIFGLIHTMLNDKARFFKDLRNSIYYSFMLFPLLLSFFQDQYMSLFSSWLQIVVYTELFILLNRVFTSKKTFVNVLPPQLS
ncbi:MAG: oligosaccharide repeat unit polymerase [Bacteroidota bacterium]|nr:oligosaccharide repeat unit polymerase [Bacteroidota bacterium]